MYLLIHTHINTHTLPPTVVPAGTKGVPVGEPLAVLVYDEEHIDAFGNLPTYQPSQRARGEGGGEEEVAVDGVTALKFIHKLLRSGEIKDKGVCVCVCLLGGGRVIGSTCTYIIAHSQVYHPHTHIHTLQNSPRSCRHWHGRRTRS